MIQLELLNRLSIVTNLSSTNFTSMPIGPLKTVATVFPNFSVRYGHTGAGYLKMSPTNKILWHIQSTAKRHKFTIFYLTKYLVASFVLEHLMLPVLLPPNLQVCTARLNCTVIQHNERGMN